MDRISRKAKGRRQKADFLFSCVFFICCLLSVFCALSSSYASDISIHGFIQGNYSVDVYESNPNGKDFKWAEERVQLKLDASKEPFYFFLKTDVLYDHIDDASHLELREGYVDYISLSYDLRIGRQIITWGLGDLIFINDIFPKDYEAFFSGRPMEYLKIGSDAVKIGMYPSFASAELVVIPFFEHNNFPARGRFWQYDPMPSVTDRNEKEPAATFENTEIALRVYRDISGYDAALYYYKGFFRQQAMLPDSMTAPARIDLVYPELSVYGASLQGRALDGILSFEAGFYDSREDRSGTAPMIPNQSIRFLAAYQKQLWKDFTAGLQYYALNMLDYDNYKDSVPAGFPQGNKLQDLLTLRLTHLFMHQTLTLSFFSFWGLSDGDYMLIPEIKYKFTDNLWAAMGANIFGGGEEWNQFGSMDDNDNIYVQARYEF